MERKQFSYQAIEQLFQKPFIQLLFEAQQIHIKYAKKNKVQLSSLCSIKSGGCPEDCAYCSQSGHYSTGIEREKLLDVDSVIEHAIEAKKNGATRFCMGAAWKTPPTKDFDAVLTLVQRVKKLGLETCVTLGEVSYDQAMMLKDSGLDYYNHNLDTSEDYYKKIITTRTYKDRLDTINNVVKSDIKICCGEIIGMGETRKDRIDFLLQLANLPTPPESVPINRLIPIGGTPLENTPQIDNFEFIRVIAVARIVLPTSVVRLSAGRESMSEEMQALCFLAGANSIFLGEKLLTAKNIPTTQDHDLLSKLGLEIE